MVVPVRREITVSGIAHDDAPLSDTGIIDILNDFGVSENQCVMHIKHQPLGLLLTIVIMAEIDQLAFATIVTRLDRYFHSILSDYAYLRCK